MLYYKYVLISKRLLNLVVILLIAGISGTGGYWLGTRNTQTNTFDEAKTACEQNKGTWFAVLKECQNGLNQAACTALGGTFDECGCMRNRKGECTPILVCTWACKF
jgi:hypothetical protein